MRKEDLEDYGGKKVKLILVSGSVFTGRIKKLTEESLHMVDKYDQLVVINLNQISNVIGLNIKDVTKNV